MTKRLLNGTADTSRALSDEHARSAGWTFTYSRDQWNVIWRAVDEGCLVPSSLRADYLLRDANLYLQDIRQHRPASEKVKAWQKAAEVTEQFYKLANENSGDKTSKNPHSRPDSRPMPLWRMVIGEDKYSQFLQTIKMCKTIAEHEVRSIRLGHYGPNHPRYAFFEHILEHWLEARGGLRAGHASNVNRVGLPDGPLVRYVSAVTGPVMGPEAPSPETIYKLIRRTKKQFEKIFQFDAAGCFIWLENGDLATQKKAG
jgi:hypothetical protein